MTEIEHGPEFFLEGLSVKIEKGYSPHSLKRAFNTYYQQLPVILSTKGIFIGLVDHRQIRSSENLSSEEVLAKGYVSKDGAILSTSAFPGAMGAQGLGVSFEVEKKLEKIMAEKIKIFFENHKSLI